MSDTHTHDHAHDHPADEGATHVPFVLSEDDWEAPVAATPEPAAEPAWMSPSPAPIEATEPEVVPEKTRAPRTNLQDDLREVLNAFNQGKIHLADGARLTPHLLAKEIEKNRKELDPNDSTKVSTGAVSAALFRWRDIGYITLLDGPLAFDDYTEAGREHGLSALRADRKISVAAAKAAAKLGAVPQPDQPAEAPAVEPETSITVDPVVPQLTDEGAIPITEHPTES